MHHWYIDLIRLVLWPLLPGVPLVILAWALWRWARSQPRITKPVWRSYLAIGAISFAGISSLLWLISIVWAGVIGGFPYSRSRATSFLSVGCLDELVGTLNQLCRQGKTEVARVWSFISYAFAVVHGGNGRMKCKTCRPSAP